MVFVFLQLEEVTIVQNVETVAENFLNVIEEAEGHEFKEVVFVEVVLHVFDNNFLEGVDFEVIENFPHVKNGAAGTLENSTIKAFHGLFEVDFLNKMAGTWRSLSIFLTFSRAGFKVLKKPDSRRK